MNTQCALNLEPQPAYWYDAPERPQIPIEEVAHSALKRCIYFMETRYGNRLTEDHKLALYYLLSEMLHMMCGDVQRRGGGPVRICWPTPTATGKTLAVRCLLAELASRGWYGVSVLICAERVESLCEMKRDLIAEGVDEGDIRLVHSGGDYSEPSQLSVPEGAEFPVCLCAHQRIKEGDHEEVEALNKHQGQRRNLVIWDESLLVTRGGRIKVSELEDIICLLAYTDRKENLSPELRDWLTGVLSAIKERMRELKDAQKKSAQLVIEIPPRVGLQELREYLEDDPKVEPLLNLLDIVHDALTISLFSEREAIIYYRPTIPSHLDPVIVLDASEPIRTLVNMPGSTVIKAKDAILERHGVKVDFEGLKRWDNNTVNQVVSGSGRTPIEVEMLKPLKKREKFRPLINAMKALPDGEAALVIHFMKRFNPYLFAKTKNKRAKKAIDHVAEIKKMVKAVKPDIAFNEKVEVTVLDAQGNPKSERKARWNFTHWGANDTATNKYGYCKHVFLFGTQKQDDADLAAAKLGQSGGVLPEDVYDVMMGEESHLVYQVDSRVSREMHDGFAAPSTLWFIHNETSMRERLKKVMPGVDYHFVSPNKRSRDKVNKLFIMGNLKDALDQLVKDDELPMFTKDLYERLDLSAVKVQEKTKRRWAQEAIKEHPELEVEGSGYGQRIVRASLLGLSRE